MLTVYAPAKVNLILEVLGKYDDNYHQISSIVQAVGLWDSLNFELADEISFTCSEPSLEAGNLVTEAAMLLKETTKYGKGYRIQLYKHIPWGVGLGGGSSDAATTLLALNELWGIHLSRSGLLHLASRLGSDVPFFVYGGTALVEGKGEKVTPLSTPHTTWFVLLAPPLPKIPRKTRQLYNRLGASHFTKGDFVQAALSSLMQGKTIEASLLFNVFDEINSDIFPQIDEYKSRFREAGAPGVSLSGCGSCLFTILYEEAEATELCLCLQRQGLECYVASSLLR
ncbi:4-diphosphocytidyl-2-C-methyl-D-erythritol kinase [subsurface metagenome]